MSGINTKNNLMNCSNRIHKSTVSYLRSAVYSLIIMTMLGQSYNAMAQVIKQAASEVTTTAKHYNYTYNISKSQYKVIEYILVRASNGDIKSTFNACDVCYPSHKGYSQSGTKLRCNNCGNSYDIDALGNQGSGGCWPGHLVHSLDGDSVVINVSDLVKGEYYFLAQTSTDVIENVNNTITIENRNNNELRVKSSDYLPKYFRIFSLEGILCKEMTAYSKEFNIDISGLPIGFYYILTESNGMPVTKSFNIVR